MHCRARLARQASHAGTSSSRTALVWQPLIAVLGVAYLVAAIVQALSVLTSNF